MSDLMRELCVVGGASKKLLFDQINKGNAMLPADAASQPAWISAVRTKSTIRTVNDATFLVLALLAGCPNYERHVTEKSNAKAMARFMGILRWSFDAFFLGRKANGERAESTQDKAFRTPIDFVMAMKYQYMIS